MTEKNYLRIVIRLLHLCGWDFCSLDAWLGDWCVTFWVNVAFSSSRVKIRHFISQG